MLKSKIKRPRQPPRLFEDRLTTIETKLEEIKGLLSKQPSGKLPWNETEYLNALELAKQGVDRWAVVKYHKTHEAKVK